MFFAWTDERWNKVGIPSSAQPGRSGKKNAVFPASAGLAGLERRNWKGLIRRTSNALQPKPRARNSRYLKKTADKTGCKIWIAAP